MNVSPTRRPTQREWFGELPEAPGDTFLGRAAGGCLVLAGGPTIGALIGSAVGPEGGAVLGAALGGLVGLLGALFIVVNQIVLGWWIGPDGVTELRLPWSRRHVAWDDIVSLTAVGRGVVLHGRDGTLTVGRGQANWRRAARLCADALGVPIEAADDQPAMDEEQLVELLGTRVPRVLKPGSVDPGCLLSLGLGLLLCFLVAGIFQPVLLILALVYAGYPLSMLWASRKMPRRAVVTAAGIELGYLGRTVFAAWPWIRALRRKGFYVVLETDAGDLGFVARGADRDLLDGIERVLAARDAGLALPRLGEVPAAAISVVRSAEAPVERGLSRGDPGG